MWRRQAAARWLVSISFEDRQDLLGHKSGRITTHYSQAELGNLIAAAEKVWATKTPANLPQPHGYVVVRAL
jgi:integrase